MLSSELALEKMPMRIERRFTQAGKEIVDLQETAQPANASMQRNPNTIYCSFCDKSEHEISWMVAGPTVFICDECIDLCHQIIEEKRAKQAPRDVGAATVRSAIGGNLDGEG